MKKIMVTGGAGFLGQQVVGLLRSHYPQSQVVPYSRRNGLDLLDLNGALALFADELPDTVVHCAAHVGGIAYNRLYPTQVFEDNMLIGLNLMKACAHAQVQRLINIMPNCTYPGAMDEYEESRWWDGPIHESVLTYGLPRKMLWGLCFAYCQSNPTFKPVHLILPNLYGPHDHFDPIRSHALGAMIAKVVQAKQNNEAHIDVWGTGKPVREWLYVKDAATAVLKTLERLDAFGSNEISNIGVGAGISILEMAQLIADLVGWEGEFVLQPDKPDGAMKKILRAENMRSKLNWMPETRLREGIRETIEWYLAHKTMT